MKVLEIDLKDFFLRMPKDYIKQLQWLNMQKVDFISDRMLDIALTQAEIVGMNPEARVYEDTQKSVQKYFGMAKQRLVNRVGDKTVLKNKMVRDNFHSNHKIDLLKEFEKLR